MKNSADLRGCYPPRPKAEVDNTLLYLQNSSYPTQPHSVIAKYWPFLPYITENHTEKLIFLLYNVLGNDSHSVTSATLLVTSATLKFKHLCKIVNASSNEISLVGSHNH